MTTEKESLPYAEWHMDEALWQAKAAADEGEIPVGCVIVWKGNVLSVGKNEVEKTGDPTAHAEMIAIKKASEVLGKNLSECDLFVTVEPCPMCTGAIVNARVGRLFIGTDEPKTGCCGSLYDLVEDARFNHNPVVIRGIRAQECKKRMADFFADRRKK